MENQVDIENDGGMIVEEKFDLERNYSTISESGSIREPLLKSKSRVNNTSQIAIVGANVYPIESLDYEYESLLVLLLLVFPTCSYRDSTIGEFSSFNSISSSNPSFDDKNSFFCYVIIEAAGN